MNSENMENAEKSSNFKSDERRGYNENSNYEDAKNDYQNIGMGVDNNNDNTNPSTNANENNNSSSVKNAQNKAG
ncbi:hypothetical protein [Segetibacter koreensis]|uniref:hypothetical protein n=1 Tax=Segetibacter koreensis TaxID=398037 RepID=UPI00037C8CD3|nr:hypothetical protein [Segetibacter koreensis]